jgi:hypothetical protein
MLLTNIDSCIPIPKESTTKESTTKKSPTKESTTKESPTKESTTKESTTKESTTKESTTKESPTKELTITDRIIESVLSTEEERNLLLSNLIYNLFSSTIKTVVENDTIYYYQYLYTKWEKITYNNSIENEIMNYIINYIDSAMYLLEFMPYNLYRTPDSEICNMILEKLRIFQKKCFDTEYRRKLFTSAAPLLYDRTFQHSSIV